jgi:DNA damage-binding protein 1
MKLTSTLLVLDRIYFKQFERPLAATSMRFENDNNEYYILATGKETDEYENNSIGRILVLQVNSQRRLSLINQIKTEGMVDCLRSFQGRLLASVRGMVKYL